MYQIKSDFQSRLAKSRQTYKNEWYYEVKSCAKKVAYKSKGKAKEISSKINRLKQANTVAYKCKFCLSYHVGNK